METKQQVKMAKRGIRKTPWYLRGGISAKNLDAAWSSAAGWQFANNVRISDIRVYRRVLTSEEITRICTEMSA